jgi:hypothetical protein
VLSLATAPISISISRVLRRVLAAGLSPEQIEQIELVGKTLDMEHAAVEAQKLADC